LQRNPQLCQTRAACTGAADLQQGKELAGADLKKGTALLNGAADLQQGKEMVLLTYSKGSKWKVFCTLPSILFSSYQAKVNSLVPFPGNFDAATKYT
jgi:hypothetical protein